MDLFEKIQKLTVGDVYLTHKSIQVMHLFVIDGKPNYSQMSAKKHFGNCPENSKITCCGVHF